MRFENVSILSVEHVDPPQALTSDEIEVRLQPAIRRLGVRPTCCWSSRASSSGGCGSPEPPCSDPGNLGGEKAIEAAGIDPLSSRRPGEHLGDARTSSSPRRVRGAPRPVALRSTA